MCNKIGVEGREIESVFFFLVRSSVMEMDAETVTVAVKKDGLEKEPAEDAEEKTGKQHQHPGEGVSEAASTPLLLAQEQLGDVEISAQQLNEEENAALIEQQKMSQMDGNPQVSLLNALNIPLEVLSRVRNHREAELMREISSSAGMFDLLLHNYETLASESQALQNSWDSLWLAQDPSVVREIPQIAACRPRNVTNESETCTVNEANGYSTSDTTETCDADFCTIVCPKFWADCYAYLYPPLGAYEVREESVQLITAIQTQGKLLPHFIDVNTTLAEELKMEGVHRLASDKLFLVAMEQELERRIQSILSGSGVCCFNPMARFVEKLMETKSIKPEVHEDDDKQSMGEVKTVDIQSDPIIFGEASQSMPASLSASHHMQNPACAAGLEAFTEVKAGDGEAPHTSAFRKAKDSATCKTDAGTAGYVCGQGYTLGVQNDGCPEMAWVSSGRSLPKGLVLNDSAGDQVPPAQPSSIPNISKPPLGVGLGCEGHPTSSSLLEVTPSSLSGSPSAELFQLNNSASASEERLPGQGAPEHAGGKLKWALAQKLLSISSQGGLKALGIGGELNQSGFNSSAGEIGEKSGI